MAAPLSSRSASTDAPADRSTGPLPLLVVSVALVLTFMSAGAPSPLYGLYQDQFGVPDAGLTGAFALYIVPVAVLLLVAGRLSDHLGRRPVAAAALLSSVAGNLVLARVDGLAPLLAGRALQGVASGMAVSSLGAYALDLAATRRPPPPAWVATTITTGGPTGGLALGAVISGALVQYGPAPQALVFYLLGAASAGCLLTLAWCPDTSPRRPGALRSLRVTIAVPVALRPLFLAACSVFIAAWALGGFYQALGPSVAARELGHPNHLFAGLVVAALIGTSAIGGPLSSRTRPRTAMVAGAAILAAATVGVLLSLAAHSPVGFFATSMTAGLGFGAGFNGGMRSLLTDLDPGRRSGVLSAAYLISYLGSALPAYLSGLLTGPWGLTAVTRAYGGLVILLAILAIAVVHRLNQQQPAPQH